MYSIWLTSSEHDREIYNLIQRFVENKGTVLLACHETKLFYFNYELLNLDLLKK